MRTVLLVFACLTPNALAQSAGQPPIIGGAGFVFPTPISVAPGQLITLFLQNLGDAAPADISAVFHQGSDVPMPILDVRGICNVPGLTCAATIRGVTVQIPYGIRTICPLCASPIDLPASFTVSVRGVPSPPLGVQPLADQIHFLTQCDVVVSSSAVNFNSGGLPCAPLISHADGTPVSFSRPAKVGEELVAYATGLGETNPPLTTGKPAPSSAPTQTVFSIDFNYRPNALATKPAAIATGAAAPLFTGGTSGFIGLYQINFMVPPPPAGLPPCLDPATIVALGNVAQSNLTVSVGSNFSFDGAGICVQP